MDSRRDFTSRKGSSGYFSELGEKANSALVRDQADMQVRVSWEDDGDCNVGKMRGRV